MSVLLQSMETAKYVRRPESWTESAGEARKFGGAMEALFYCYHHHLENMKILGQFGDPEKDFSIPLRQIGMRESETMAAE
jgi:hypothetical protein